MAEIRQKMEGKAKIFQGEGFAKVSTPGGFGLPLGHPWLIPIRFDPLLCLFFTAFYIWYIKANI